MARIPVLAIGGDGGWRLRLERLLACRSDLEWLGAYAPAQARPQASHVAAVLLLDGDDPKVERARRHPLSPAPVRLYFFLRPQVDALRLCVTRGACGCLDKRAPAEEVLRALRAIDAGLFAVEPALLRQAMSACGSNWTADAAPSVDADDLAQLTLRQRQIVGCATRGLSNKQIARVLGISPETVKTHLHHIFEREGVHTRMELAAIQRHAGSQHDEPR